jgi:hypothetical protein
MSVIHSARCTKCYQSIRIGGWLPSRSEKATVCIDGNYYTAKVVIDQETVHKCMHWEIELKPKTGFFTHILDQDVDLKVTNMETKTIEIIPELYWTHSRTEKISPFIYYSIQTKPISIEKLCRVAQLPLPRAFCTHCAGKGKTAYNGTIQSYVRCGHCDGTGGLVCTTCLGTPIIGTAHPGFENVLTKLCTDCTKGFKEICKACNGARALRAERQERETFIVCTHCVDIQV